MSQREELLRFQVMAEQRAASLRDEHGALSKDQKLIMAHAIQTMLATGNPYYILISRVAGTQLAMWDCEQTLRDLEAEQNGNAEG